MTLLQRILFGPKSAPGPQYDRQYVRPLVFDVDALAAAVPILAPSGARVSWGDSEATHDAAYDGLELPVAQFMTIGGDGGLLQIGTAAPAMIYFGDDAAQARVWEAYGRLRQRGRFRFDSRRLWAWAPVLGGTLAAAAGFILLLLDGPSEFGVTSAIIGLVVAAVTIVSSAIAISRRVWIPIPHQIERPRV